MCDPTLSAALTDFAFEGWVANALEFQASVRFDIRETGVVKNGEQPVGNTG